MPNIATYDFQLTAANIARIVSARVSDGCRRRMRVRTSPASTVSAPVAPTRAGTLFPAQSDTLFWCFYIIHKGIFAYETVKDKSFVEEKQVKIQLVTELRAADLKALSAQYPGAFKWRRRELEDELVTAKRISLKTFLCLCAFYRHNIWVISGRRAQRLSGDGELQILHAVEGRYGLDLADTATRESKGGKYYAQYWNVPNICRAMRALSGYKAAELRDICERLKIQRVQPSGKAFTKAQMYAAIQEQA